MPTRRATVPFPLGSHRASRRSSAGQPHQPPPPANWSPPVSFHPDHLAPTFDVIGELTNNRDAYSGKEWVTVNAFPSYIRTSLERMRSRVPDPKPGLSPVISCCTSLGLSVLSTHESVHALVALKEELNAREGSAEEIEECASWFRSFPLSMPDSTTAGSRRQTFTTTDHVRMALGEFSSEIGVSMSALVVLCTAVTLCDQQAVLAQRRHDLASAVEKFFHRVRIRHGVAQRWLGMIEDRKSSALRMA